MSEEIKEPKIELSGDALKELIKEQSSYQKQVMSYKLPKVLDDVSNPLTFGEKKKLKEFNLKNIDSLDDEAFDDLLAELLEMRKLDNDTVDSLQYSDLQMWIRRVMLTSFNPEVIATKK